MFDEIAKEWIRELQQQGKLGDRDKGYLDKLALDYSRRLEDFFNQEVVRQLKPLNKDQEYERMLLWDSQYTFKYLNQTIPAFHSFKEEVIARAKRLIIENDGEALDP